MIMSQVLDRLHKTFEENPFVTIDSEGNGKSRIYVDEWDFTALGQSKTKVNFKNIEKPHRKNVQSYLSAIIEYQKSYSSSNEHLSVSTLMTHLRNMKRLITHWGSSDFSLLSDERVWKRVKRKIKGLWSISSLNNLATTINVMSCAGLVDRYVCREEYLPLANNHIEKQAIALPERMHAGVLSQVVECIEKYHPYRHAISEVMDKSYQFKDKEYPLELVKRGRTELTTQQVNTFNQRIVRNSTKMAQSYEIPDFKVKFDSKWINDLIRHCLICVGLFSGARIKEILSMNKDSYDVVNGIPIVSGLTSKGEDGQPFYTTWNTHPIVEQALELAYDATEYARSRQKLLLKAALKNDEIDQDKFHRGLEELNGAFITCDLADRRVDIKDRQYQLKSDGLSGIGLALFDIKASEEDIEEFDLLNPSRAGSMKLGGTLPKLSPHDLRRSFAVFLVRHRLGNHQTLKYQLKHKNLNMPRWYANYSELARTNKLLMDEELLKECNEAMEEAALDDIYNGSTALSGVEGKKIAERKLEKLRNGEQVYMNREELRALLKSKDKSIVLLPTGGYCTNRDCERLCSMMDLIEKKNCSHKVITDKGAKRLGRERNELILSFREMNEMDDYAYSTILLARKQKILFIEQTLDEHNIPHEKFTDKIRVLSL